MKKYLPLILTGLAIGMAKNAGAQLQGKIIDAQSRQPLTGATIKVLDNGLGYGANANGTFALPLSPGRYQLQVSSIG